MHNLKIFFFFLLTTSWVFCQQDSLTVSYDETKLEIKKIDKNDLQKYQNDKDFNYNETKAKPNFLSKIRQWFRNILLKILEWLFGVGPAKGILKFVLNVLPYLILAFLIFLLIKFFLKVDSKNIISGKQNAANISFSEDENIIKNEDINTLINNALNQQNYRLAIRYYYLLALKKLSDNQSINWQTQKTNADYINEIQTEYIKSKFINITKIYDYVWYGEFYIDAIKFESLKKPFEQLNKSLAS